MKVLASNGTEKYLLSVSWSDLHGSLFPDPLLYTLKWYSTFKACGQGRIGLCGGLFSKPHSPDVPGVLQFGFAWLAWIY